MKLTSKEIRNIIKEELERLLLEQESKESLSTRLLGAYKNKIKALEIGPKLKQEKEKLEKDIAKAQKQKKDKKLEALQQKKKELEENEKKLEKQAKDRYQALEDFLDFFESTEIGTYDNKFAYKWLKVLLSTYGAEENGGFRKALQARIPGSPNSAYVKERKNLDLVLELGNYDNYVAIFNKRAEEEEAKKAEEERAEELAKAQKAAAAAEEEPERKKASDREFRARLAALDKSIVDYYSGD